MIRLFNPRWRKVLRDIWGNKARTLLVVLAIAVGVFAFGGVFITQEVLITDMNTGYAAINPASIILSGGGFNGGGFTDEVVRSVEDMPGVAYAEGRITYSIKILSEPPPLPENMARIYEALGLPTEQEAAWLNLDLKALPDYINIQTNRITAEQGSFPPELREIFFERKSVPLINARIGDMVRVELPDGEQYELRFGGTVHDFNAIPANLFPQLSGYASVETLRWLGHPGTYNEINVVTSGAITDVEELEKIGEKLADRLALDGYPAGFAAQDPSQHWAADVTQAFTTVLGVIGMMALGLSGFLVINTISAVLTQQKRQIGMMKAVGARNGQVIGVYMTMVAVFGILSLIVALPVGTGLARGITTIIADFLNVDILNFHVPVMVLAMQVFTALGAPLLAGLVPVIGGTRITVREAVSDYGISGVQKHDLLDRLLTGVRGLPRPTLLSLRNTFRRRGRLFLTLSTLTLAGAIFIAVLNVRSSLFVELDKIMNLFGYDLQMVLDGPYPVSRLQREALRVEGVTRVEGWAFGQATIIYDDNTEGSDFIVFGPPGDTPFIKPALEAGRWLEPDDQNAIVLSSEVLRNEPDIEVGDEITLKFGDSKRKWKVVGVVTLTGPTFAYANFDYFSRYLGAPGQSFVLIGGTEQHDGRFQAQVARALEERLKLSGIGVAQSLTTATIIGAQISQFNFLIAFMLFMAVLLAIVGGLGLAGTMSLNVLERTREIGVMRSVGASNGAIASIVLWEGLLIGLMSWFFGTLISLPMTWGMITAVGNAFFQRPMDFAFAPEGVTVWLVIAMIISAVASLLPARRAAQVSVRESLAYE